jgi:hypothetical protein
MTYSSLPAAVASQFHGPAVTISFVTDGFVPYSDFLNLGSVSVADFEL